MKRPQMSKKQPLVSRDQGLMGITVFFFAFFLCGTVFADSLQVLADPSYKFQPTVSVEGAPATLIYESGDGVSGQQMTFQVSNDTEPAYIYWYLSVSNAHVQSLLVAGQTLISYEARLSIINDFSTNSHPFSISDDGQSGMGMVDPRNFPDSSQYFDMSVWVSVQYIIEAPDGQGGTIRQTKLESTHYTPAIRIYKKRRVVWLASDEDVRVQVSDMVPNGTASMQMQPAIGAEIIPKAGNLKFFPASSPAFLNNEGDTAADAFFSIDSPWANYHNGGGTVQPFITDINIDIEGVEEKPKSTEIPFCMVSDIQGKVYRIPELGGGQVLLRRGDGLYPGVTVIGEISFNPNGSRIYPAFILKCGGDFISYQLFNAKGNATGLKIGPRGADRLGEVQSTVDLMIDSISFDAQYQPRELLKVGVEKAWGGLIGTMTGAGYWTARAAGKTAGWGIRKVFGYLDQNRRAPSGQDPVVTQYIGTPLAESFDISVLENGSVQFTNRGSSLVVSDATKSHLIPYGTTRTINSFTGNSASPIQGLPVPFSSQPPTINIDPPNGSTVTTRMPVITLNYVNINSDHQLAPGGLICRLNGILISQYFQRKTTLKQFYSVPARMALKNGTNTIEVIARTKGGMTVTASSTFTVDSQLPAPDGLHTLAGNSHIFIRWNPGKSSDVHSYRVYRSTDKAQVGTFMTEVTQPVFRDNSPDPGTVWYRVAAVDSNLQEGILSSPVAASHVPYTTLPAADITNVSAIAGNQRVDISFTADLATNAAWSLERGDTASGPFSTVLGGQDILGTTTYTDSQLVNGQSYWYKITPVNKNNIPGTANIAGPVTPQGMASPVPTGFTGKLDNAQVTLTWDPPPDNAGVTGYRIYQGEFEKPFTLASGQNESCCSFTIPIAQNQLKLFYVTAVNEENLQSGGSTLVEVSTWTDSSSAFPWTMFLPAITGSSHP